MVFIASILHLKLYKNNNLILEQKNIAYSKNNDKILFNLDGVDNKLEIKDDYLLFEREDATSYFNINLTSAKNTCQCMLKELDTLVDIIVDDGEFHFQDNILVINYQIETDDEFTTIEIEFS